jgi:hypothetical protein
MKETSSHGNDNYRPGDNWGICQECGLKFHASQLIKRYDHLIVCKNDFELRHPQEEMRSKADKIRATVVSPEAEDYYITTAITQDDL